MTASFSRFKVRSRHSVCDLGVIHVMVVLVVLRVGGVRVVG